jgi:phosphopantothenoylcysteine synthetase/decarboxylase
MGRKKIVRKPIEKLSEKEQIEVIEDSSSEEEEEDIPAPPKLVKEKPKRQRSAKQLLNDQRLRDLAAARKAGKAKIAPEPIKETPQQDPDDKPMTMKEYKALLASQKTEDIVKPKRKYTKRSKQEAPILATPTPSPTPPPKPNMMFV